jgi:uracil-DNA glycosylase
MAQHPPHNDGPETDFGATLRDIRRSLDDLLAFEGRYFVVPESAAVPALVADVADVAGDDGDDGDDGEGDGGDLDAFRQEICDCVRCPLGHTRNQFVFGSGNATADIMFVGEAPGQEEDRQGLPFVGAAGELLTKIIGAMKLSREDVYICNVLKCRPPNNRDPQPDEVASCEPYLQRQIELVRPRVICCLGRHAAHALLKTDVSLSRLRGQLHEYQGIQLVVTYHPAALLRNAQYKRPVWEDMKWVRKLHDGTEL